MKISKIFINKLILSLALISLILLNSMPAFAASKYPVFYLTDINCKPSEEVVVFLRIFDAEGLQAGDGQIFYDSDILEFVSFEEPQEAKAADILIEGGISSEGLISFAYLHMHEVEKEHNNFNLAKITFKAIKEAESYLTLSTTSLETSQNKSDIASKYEDIIAKVKIGKGIDSILLSGIDEADIDWSGIDPNKLAKADDSKPAGLLSNTYILVGGIIFIAAIGIVVVVSVLRRKSTDVNPNKIDIEK